MRFLMRLGDHVARREVEEPAVELHGVLGEARDERLHRLFPHVALVAHPAAERMELDGPLPLAESELDPAAAQQIERGDALGNADRMVGRELDDAVAEPDARRPLARRAQEDLGRGRVRVLLEEVVLHLPRVVVAQPVGQLDLIERVLEEPVLAVRGPRPRKLVLVEDPESHRAPFVYPG